MNLRMPVKDIIQVTKMKPNKTGISVQIQTETI